MTLVGRYDHQRSAALMRNIDWVIVPSIWWENSPLVIQEAFMYGRPVICSDIGGMAEKVRDGVDGLHFRAGDAQDLADTITAGCRRPRPMVDVAREHPPCLPDGGSSGGAVPMVRRHPRATRRGDHRMSQRAVFEAVTGDAPDGQSSEPTADATMLYAAWLHPRSLLCVTTWAGRRSRQPLRGKGEHTSATTTFRAFVHTLPPDRDRPGGSLVLLAFDEPVDTHLQLDGFVLDPERRQSESHGRRRVRTRTT